MAVENKLFTQERLLSQRCEAAMTYMAKYFEGVEEGGVVVFVILISPLENVHWCTEESPLLGSIPPICRRRPPVMKTSGLVQQQHLVCPVPYKHLVSVS